MKPGFLSEIFVSFQGEGAHVGQRHLFVRLAGCNMRCRYCDTPDSLERTDGFSIHWHDRTESRINPVTPARIAELIRIFLDSYVPIDAVAITGGEPLTQSEFLASLLQAARVPIPVLLETNGVLALRLREVLPLVDIVSMDIKLPSNTGEGAFWDQHEEFLHLSRDKDLYVKILVDAATLEEDIVRATGLVRKCAPGAPVFLQPIVDPDGLPAINAVKLDALFVTARRLVDTARVLPQTHKLLGIR